MAQIKKVSNKAAKGQKKDKSLSKKAKILIATFITGIVIGAAVAVTLIFVLKKDTTADSNFVDYFKYQTFESYEKDEKGLKDENGRDVKFNFMTYAGVISHHNPYLDPKETLNDKKVYYKYVFVYAIDFSTLTPDKAFKDAEIDSDDEYYNAKQYNEQHETLRNRLMRLQCEIEDYNATVEEEEQAILYLVDLRYSFNQGIMDDSNFTGGKDGSTSLFTVLTGYGNDSNKFGTITHEFEITQKGTTVSSLPLVDNINEFNTTAFNRACDLLDVKFDEADVRKGVLGE